MRNQFYIQSKDGITQIHVMEWIPDSKIRAILQIAHGMVEHIERYDEFATYLSEQGIYVVGHSHLGHGKSVTGKDKLGYFHAPNGNACVIGDIHELRQITQKKYPDIPYYMLGHSMGSFLLRQYLGLYSSDLAGAIIMGTGNQSEIALAGGKCVCKVLAAFKGWEYRSDFVNSLVIGGYEKKMGKAWLTKNTEKAAQYANDPLCGFVFTLNGFYHMFDGMAKMNKQEKAGNIPKVLPIVFVAGSEDPVGNNGKGVEAVYQRYLEKGAKNVSLKLYEGDRHEILNELDRVTVYKDILSWMER